MVSSVQPKVNLNPVASSAQAAGTSAASASKTVANTAGAASPVTQSGAAGAQNSQTMTDMILQLLMLTLQLAMQSMGGGQSAGSAGAAAQPFSASSAPVTSGATVAPTPVVSSAGSASNAATPASGALSANDEAAIEKLSSDPQVQASLRQGATTPDGLALVRNAAKNNVKIQAGDPATAQGANDVAVQCNCPACQAAAQDAGLVVNGVTLSNGNNTRVVVRDPSNVKTLFHELVHANTTADGNSRDEEGIADVIGSRIANASGGQGGLAGSEQQIFLNKQQFYPGLQQTNSIRQDLANLGITVNV